MGNLQRRALFEELSCLAGSAGATSYCPSPEQFLLETIPNRSKSRGRRVFEMRRSSALFHFVLMAAPEITLT